MNQFDPVAFGKAMGEMVKEAVLPLLERIEALEKAAPPDLVGELLATDKVSTLVELEVAKAVTDYFEQNPVHHGKDGEKGDRGEKGRDGIDVKDLFRGEGGRLIGVLSDGTTKDLGEFVGPAGKDGSDFSDAEIDFDGERTFTIRGKNTEVTKRVAIPLDRGYWQAGFVAEKGDIVTHNGPAWIATDDTSEEPSVSAKGWRVFARKGRDGRDAQIVRIPESVKLHG